MNKNIMLFVGLAVVMLMIMPGSARSSDCSKGMVDSMKEEGLSQQQINRICLKAAMKDEGLSDEQIERIMLKTGAIPAVQPQAATAPAPAQPAAAAPAAATPAPAPPPPKVLSPDFPPSKIEADIIGRCVGGLLGWCFAKDEYRDIEIQETEIDHNQARVIFHCQTLNDHSGKLLARYRRSKGEWKLDKLEPIDFR